MLKLIRHITASKHTVEKRISVISDDIISNLQKNFRESSVLILPFDKFLKIIHKLLYFFFNIKPRTQRSTIESYCAKGYHTIYKKRP